ncbi:MAG: elongation factor P [Candidatus Margulisbacteria bacterium]|nr:elongation factor P [Candidatus Margulisiibacteriota bacterium]
MVLGASELRPGKIIELDTELFNVVEYNHNKTGRGGAVIKVKVRNLSTGATTEKLFRPGDKIQDAHIETRRMQYLYKDDNQYTFMDVQNFEQITVDSASLGDAVSFIVENNEVDLQFYKEKVVGVYLPFNVTLKVIKTEPGRKGDTVTNVTKPATLETGLVVQVPIFVNEGNFIKVDTRDHNYIERM